MEHRHMVALNSLVTFAVEQLGDFSLTEEERQAAQLVRDMSLCGAKRTHDYKRTNPTGYPSIEACLDAWSNRGWRLVAVISDNRPGYADVIIFERPVGMSHPDD